MANLPAFVAFDGTCGAVMCNKTTSQIRLQAGGNALQTLSPFEETASLRNSLKGAQLENSQRGIEHFAGFAGHFLGRIDRWNTRYPLCVDHDPPRRRNAGPHAQRHCRGSARPRRYLARNGIRRAGPCAALLHRAQRRNNVLPGQSKADDPHDSSGSLRTCVRGDRVFRHEPDRASSLGATRPSALPSPGFPGGDVLDWFAHRALSSPILAP